MHTRNTVCIQAHSFDFFEKEHDQRAICLDLNFHSFVLRNIAKFTQALRLSGFRSSWCFLMIGQAKCALRALQISYYGQSSKAHTMLPTSFRGMSTVAQLNSCLVFNPCLKGKWVYCRFPSGEGDSPYWETPTSLAVCSSWSFTHWQNNLKRAGYCLEYLVDQELEAEDNPLTTAGWRAETCLLCSNKTSNLTTTTATHILAGIATGCTLGCLYSLTD